MMQTRTDDDNDPEHKHEPTTVAMYACRDCMAVMVGHSPECSACGSTKGFARVIPSERGDNDD